MKKILLSLGTVSTALAPVVATVSCGNVTTKHYKLLPTYTGQADQLLALGIAPDYYPLQLNQSQPYEYITNPGKFMQHQSEDFRNAFSSKMSSLYGQIGEKGRSWWNLNAEKNDNSNPDKEYWTTKEGDLTLYEHYLLDDDKKIIDSDQAPSYDAAIQTNFRWSQDPYTRLSKEAINEAFDNPETTNDQAQKIQEIFGLRNKDGKIETMWEEKAINGKKIFIAKMDDESKWDQNNALFDDAWFAYSWHTGMLDNPLLDKGGEAENFSKFIINSDGQNSNNIFHKDKNIDIKLASLFAQSTITNDQVDAGLNELNYHHINPTKPFETFHHPIYDAQTNIGEAPMYEGARRENMLYLYNLASQLTNTVKGKDSWGQDGSQQQKDLATTLALDFEGDSRLSQMKDALSNANKIAGDLDERLDNIKEYFKAIGVDGKTVAFTTIAPGGGVSTIQTNSKYSFMFDRIGLNYALPTDFDDVVSSFDRNKPEDSIFSMDDNGWFWNIGSGKNNLQNAKQHFEKTADLLILSVRDKEWDGMPEIEKSNLSVITKKELTTKELQESKVDYDLWNEGLKTPFVLNMILDDLITRVETMAPTSTLEANKDKKEVALNWGKYWTEDFIK